VDAGATSNAVPLEMIKLALFKARCAFCNKLVSADSPNKTTFGNAIVR